MKKSLPFFLVLLDFLRILYYLLLKLKEMKNEKLNQIREGVMLRLLKEGITLSNAQWEYLSVSIYYSLSVDLSVPEDKIEELMTDIIVSRNFLYGLPDDEILKSLSPNLDWIKTQLHLV